MNSKHRNIFESAILLPTLVLTLLGSPVSVAQAATAQRQADQELQADQEQPAEKQAPSKPKSTDESSNQAKTKGSKQGSEKDKTFIPSEEISEDFAVSFPVDI